MRSMGLRSIMPSSASHVSQRDELRRMGRRGLADRVAGSDAGRVHLLKRSRGGAIPNPGSMLLEPQDELVLRARLGPGYEGVGQQGWPTGALAGLSDSRLAGLYGTLDLADAQRPSLQSVRPAAERTHERDRQLLGRQHDWLRRIPGHQILRAAQEGCPRRKRDARRRPTTPP